MADVVHFRRPERQGRNWVFQGSGECIYCGSVIYDPNLSDRKLADQHILPYALNGNIILPRASCKRCEKITSSFEHVLCRTIFGPFRIHFGLQTRRRKQRPTTLPLHVYYNDDDQFEVVEVPLQAHPAWCYLYDLPPPRLLGKDPDRQRSIQGYFPLGALETREHLGRLADFLGARQVAISATMRPDCLWLALAKIGHAFACAHFGSANFHPFLNEIILRNQHDNLSLYIGCSTQEHRQKSLHHLNLRIEKRGRQQLVVVEISFFSKFNMLIYDVVAGRLFKDGREPRDLAQNVF